MSHIGRDVSILVDGITYMISRFTRAIASQFLDWADKVLPHPLDTLRGKLDGFPEAVQQQLVKDAIDRTTLRKSITNPDVKALMNSPEGGFKILHLLLAKHHPELSEEAASDLFQACIKEHGEDYLVGKLLEAQGELSVKEDGGNEKKAG